jgi:cytoskeletal protein CcmA (bactofilin family)
MPRLDEVRFRGAFPLSKPHTTIAGLEQRNLEVSDSTRVDGMIVGNVTVKKNGTLDLHGMIAGSVTIEYGAVVYLNGMVTGDVTTSGALGIFGMICGRLEVKNDAPVAIAGWAPVR